MPSKGVWDDARVRKMPETRWRFLDAKSASWSLHSTNFIPTGVKCITGMVGDAV